jgi:hypothetical protein
MIFLLYEEIEMKRLVMAFACVLTAVNTAWAANPSGVPASAVKLDAAGITDLYQGARASFDNKQNDVTLTGDIFYDLENKHMLGTYVWDKKDRGLFKGKIWVKGDQFCNKPDKGKETCTDVWRDGKTYYEVDAKGKITSIDTLLGSPPAPPTEAKKLAPDEVFELVKGKRIFVWVYDFGAPLVADVKWDLKKKASVGKYIMGGKEGNATAKYIVEGDQICFPTKKSKDCYDYYATDSGFVEVNASGAVHGVSVFQ